MSGGRRVTMLLALLADAAGGFDRVRGASASARRYARTGIVFKALRLVHHARGQLARGTMASRSRLSSSMRWRSD